MHIALIGIGGFAGAVARYAVDGWVAARFAGAFPAGTLVVNLSGTFFIGILFAATVERGVVPADLRGPLMIGFLGAYTTFSTFVLETWRLAEDGATTLALLNVAGSMMLGLVAVIAGLAIGRLI